MHIHNYINIILLCIYLQAYVEPKVEDQLEHLDGSLLDLEESFVLFALLEPSTLTKVFLDLFCVLTRFLCKLVHKDIIF